MGKTVGLRVFVSLPVKLENSNDNPTCYSRKILLGVTNNKAYRNRVLY